MWSGQRDAVVTKSIAWRSESVLEPFPLWQSWLGEETALCEGETIVELRRWRLLRNCGRCHRVLL